MWCVWFGVDCGPSRTNLSAHFDDKSAFRPCGRDLVEFFNSTGWAFLVQVDYFRVVRQNEAALRRTLSRARTERHRRFETKSLEELSVSRYDEAIRA